MICANRGFVTAFLPHRVRMPRPIPEPTGPTPEELEKELEFQALLEEEKVWNFGREARRLLTEEQRLGVLILQTPNGNGRNGCLH